MLLVIILGCSLRESILVFKAGFIVFYIHVQCNSCVSLATSEVLSDLSSVSSECRQVSCLQDGEYGVCMDASLACNPSSKNPKSYPSTPVPSGAYR